jgi:hypothetical protein
MMQRDRRMIRGYGARCHNVPTLVQKTFRLSSQIQNVVTSGTPDSMNWQSEPASSGWRPCSVSSSARSTGREPLEDGWPASPYHTDSQLACRREIVTPGVRQGQKTDLA